MHKTLRRPPTATPNVVEIATVALCVFGVAIVVALQTFQLCCQS